jgi:hypothetical protein
MIRGKPQFKITHGSVGPDEEGVAFGRVFSGGLARDGTILYRPKLGVALPSCKVFAIKQILDACVGSQRSASANQQANGYGRGQRDPDQSRFHRGAIRMMGLRFQF